MSADSSGPCKPVDGSSPGSSKPEAGEVTEGNVGNACKSQTHSTTHCAQSETNHTPTSAHTHSTDGTHQDGASCHGDKGAKVGVQKNGLTSMAEKVSNSEQKCKGKSSYTEVVGTQSGRNEDSESSVEDEDQSGEVQSSGGKGGKRDKTCSITRSDNDARDHRDEAVQEGEKITLDENHRGKSDCNSLPKGNEQKNKSDGAIPGVKDEKPHHKSGCNDTEKSISVNESNIDDVAMQEAKIENHDQNSELKHTSKRPVGNENDIDEGAMQRARDEKHDQNNGNKDIDNRPGRNEKYTDNKIRPSVENENNGVGDTEERPMKYEKNDKGDITTEAVKEESPDVNKKINNTKKEFRENEKKDHPYNGTTKDQDDKTKSISQARNLELSDKTASVLGDPDKPFDVSDGGTKESKDKGALPETTPLTQTAQPCNQMDYYACHQDEVGATHSEASQETSSSSQSQDDYTILDKQLDGVIDEILTESNLKESIEERKKSAREKLKSFFLAKVMDGSLSQRSHYPCATKSMPLQIFDSDIHITETRRGDAKGVMQGGGAEDGPSSSQDKLGYGKTRRTPNPEAGKPPLPQSPKIPAETNRKDARAARREQSARDKPSSSQHNQANDPTDPSKCTTDPDVEIQFIDSVENRQGPPEQSNPQTMGGISLHGKTSRAPNPKAGDSHFSKSCSSTEKTSSTPNPEAGKPPLPQSPNIPAEINRKDARAVRREQNARDKPSSSQHNQANDPTDLSKCTTDPDVEIPFIDSEENRQEPQEQSTLQTKGAVSLHGKTSRDPNPKAGDSHFSKSCSSTESCSQTGKQDTTAIHLNSSLSAASSSRVSSDNLQITLGGREKKIGPMQVGSSEELRSFDIYCRKEDFYKLFLIFDGAFLKKNGAKFRSRGRFPSITISISSSHKRVELALQDVEDFAKKMLPTITAKSQKLRKTAESLIDSCKNCKEKVMELKNEDVQVYFDADDSERLWFVSENSQLVEQSLGLLDNDDLFEKGTSTPSSYDPLNPRLITYPLSSLEMAICMKFKIESALKVKYGKKISEIFTDESKSDLMISIKSIDDSIIKKEIEKLLDEKKATRSTVKKIPQCCINFLEMPDISKEIGTEILYVIDFQNERCEAEVYSDTQGHAREVVSIIEDLFQQKEVVFEDFDTDSLILKTKVEDWRKDFFPMVKIELGTNHIKVWGLRKSVHLILQQLDSYIQQNKNATSLELNVEDEPVSADEKPGFEGNIFIYKKEEVTLVSNPAFKEKITEIQAKHKCSIEIEKENAFPLMEKTQIGWRWHFLDGRSVYFNKTEVLNIKVNKTNCIVAFFPETDRSKPGVIIFPDKKNVLWATVTLPIWRGGADKEKEHLRNFIQHLLQSLRDNNISSVTIPLMIESNIQWPERQLLKQILFWRRLFINRIVFCHPNEEIYKKLLPVFQKLTDEPKEEKICIRIENKSFTQMKVQILVNTVGSDLKLNQGSVSRSILQAAGKEIQNEANKKFPKGLPGGKVLVTDAYNLREKGILKVFHGSLLWWKEHESIADIKSFVAKCLHLATEYGMTSIAFPALGTGNLGYDHSTVATAMFETVRSFMEGSVYTSVKEVVFNVFDEKSKEAFFTEDKKYMDKPCISGTFLPRICRFAINDLTFELYCGEVWTQNAKGLIVLYESNEIFHQEEKVCIAECGKHAKCFGGQFTENKLKQTLQSKKLHMIKNKIGRPVEWVFYMTWRSGCELDSALFAMNCAEEENLDSVAFVISKKDGVAGKLSDIMRSVFAASKKIRKDSPLRRVILVVDPALSSAAYKTAEDHIPELIDIQKKRYQVWFACNSHNSLQSAKGEVMSALEHLRNTAPSMPSYDEAKIVEPKDNQTGKDYSEKHVQNEDEKTFGHQRNQEENSTIKIASEKCSLILRISSVQLLERGEDFIRQRLQKDVSELKVPVKIIFPFLKEGDALLKFQTQDDLVEFKQKFKQDDLFLKNQDVQAVTCVNATVSETARTKLLEQGWTENDISERSGVELRSDNDILVLEGSLPEIQAAREFLKVACFKCKPAARKNETSKVVENESLDFVNVLDKQGSINKDLHYENEFSYSIQDKSKFIKEALKENKDVEDFKGDNTNPESRLVDNGNNKLANQASRSGFLAKSVNIQEPGDQSIRPKKKVFFSHFDYAILENLFPLHVDVTSKVHISKTDRAHVEVVGMNESIQPFIDAKSRIQGLTKIPLDVNKKTINQIEKNLQTYQAKVQSLSPNVYILIHEEKIHLISTEEAPDLVPNVLSILTPKQKNRGEVKTGLGVPNYDSNLKGEPTAPLPACVQEQFGNPVLKKKGTRVFVIHGNVFTLDVFDCFVNPTNESLDLKKNGGLSAVVHMKAGEDVQRECFQIIKDKGKLQVGKCVSTTAGNLKYRRIIHTLVRSWKSFKLTKDRCQEAMDHIKNVVIECLKLASTYKIKSMVFPAIGSGQSAIPPIVLAYGYRLGCEAFMKEQTHLSEIYFAINNVDFLSLVEMTCRSPIPWCSFLSESDEYTYNMSIQRKVVVAKRDVLQERNVDALVVLEDPLMHGEERIAKHVLQSKCQVYRSNRDKLKNREHPPGSAAACKYVGNLQYNKIVHIYMPDCKQWKEEKDVLNYKTCISNALTSIKEANNSIAMELFVGDTKSKPVIRYYAKALAEAVIEHTTSKESTLQKIFILNANPACHGLVTEEFNRYLMSMCNSNAYFEEAVFVNCGGVMKTMESQI